MHNFRQNVLPPPKLVWALYT